MSAKYDRVTVWCVFHVLFYSWLWFIISHGPWKTLSVVAFGCEHISRKSSSIRWCHFLCFWHGLEETNMNCFSTSWPEYLSRIFLQVFQTWHLWVQWPMASLTFLCLVSVLPVPGIPRLLNHILSSCAKNWHLAFTRLTWRLSQKIILGTCNDPSGKPEGTYVATSGKLATFWWDGLAEGLAVPWVDGEHLETFV